MSRDWRMYLRDMRNFCDRIVSYSDGLAREAFERHDLTYDAIVRNIELLGEAARRIPQDVRDRASGIEWQKIIALRNILIHGYFGIDDDILWDVVTNRIKPLRLALETLDSELP
ncbi:MAG: DUF86 domain-containing protein [Candidatus Methylophosphatis roskildensis]